MRSERRALRAIAADPSATGGGGDADRNLAHVVGTLLRGGVLLATAVAAAGIIVFLRKHGSDTPRFSDFHAAPVSISAVARSLTGLRTDNGRTLMLAGLLILIATPVVRVIVSSLDFIRERNWTYVVLTVLVLGALTGSIVQAR